MTTTGGGASITEDVEADVAMESGKPVFESTFMSGLFAVVAQSEETCRSCSSNNPLSVGRSVGAWVRRVTAEFKGPELANVAPAERVIVRRRTPEKVFAIGMVMPKGKTHQLVVSTFCNDSIPCTMTDVSTRK